MLTTGPVSLMLILGKNAVFDTLYIQPPPQTRAADVKPLLSVDSFNYKDFSLFYHRMAGVLVSALASHAGEQGLSPSGFCKRFKQDARSAITIKH